MMGSNWQILGDRGRDGGEAETHGSDADESVDTPLQGSLNTRCEKCAQQDQTDSQSSAPTILQIKHNSGNLAVSTVTKQEKNSRCHTTKELPSFLHNRHQKCGKRAYSEEQEAV